MKELITKLEHLMEGLNYCTTFGYEELGLANNRQDLKQLIKNTFPNSIPFDVELLEISASEFWKKIQFGFDYRGDYAAGMNLNQKQEEELKTIQENFIFGIKKKIDSESKFYHYPSEEGIPGYVVMWDFCLLFNKGKEWFFVYGSASD